MFRVLHLLLPMILALFYSTEVHSLEMNCTYFQQKVPTPQLKYMLSGQLHVIWQENETIGYNYKAHSCCSKRLPYSYSGCQDSCPQFHAISSCMTANSSTDTNVRQCSMRVFEYFEYTIYLSGEEHGCELTGKMIKIRPRLRIAWPDPVPSLNVYSIYNGLLIEWTKSLRYMQLLYSLRCQQLSWTHNKVLKKSMNKDLKSYVCCIRVYLPYFGSSRYSEVCEVSQNKEITSKFHCDYSHECKIAEVDKLQYFTGQFKPSNAKWPKTPPAMVLQIKKRNTRHKRKENPLIV